MYILIASLPRRSDRGDNNSLSFIVSTDQTRQYLSDSALKILTVAITCRVHCLIFTQADNVKNSSNCSRNEILSNHATVNYVPSVA